MIPNSQIPENGGSVSDGLLLASGTFSAQKTQASLFKHGEGSSTEGYTSKPLSIVNGKAYACETSAPYTRMFQAIAVDVRIADGSTEFPDDLVQDIANVRRNFYLMAEVKTEKGDTKQINLGTLDQWPAGKGLADIHFVNGAATLTKDRSVINCGAPDRSAIRALPYPFTVQMGQPFKLDVICGRDTVTNQDLEIVIECP